MASDASVAAASSTINALLEEKKLDLATIVNNAGVNAHGVILLSDGGSVASYEWNVWRERVWSSEGNAAVTARRRWCRLKSPTFWLLHHTTKRTLLHEITTKRH